MEILLHKVCSRPASRTMTLRAAGPEDAAAFSRLAERGAGRDAPPGAVRTRHAGKHRPLPERGPVHRRVGRRAAGAYFILRYCGQDAHNYAALWASREKSGTAGPTPTAPSSTRLPGQRSAAEAAGSGAAGSARASWASGPPSARKISTASTTPWPAALRSSAAGEMYGGYDRYLLAKGCQMIQLRVSSERRGCSFAMPEKSHYS